MKIDSEFVNILKKPNFNEPKTNDEKKLKEAAQDFEAIFLKMLIDNMDRTVNRKESLFYGGQGEEVFRSMLNEERAKNIAHGQGIGLAKVIYEQMAKYVNRENAK